MSEIINTYILGDIQAIYVLDDNTKNPELVLLPMGMEYREQDREKPYADTLALQCARVKLQRGFVM